MIKKSLSIALLSVTVLALGACSSDDDDANPVVETPTGTADAGAADAGAADAGAADAGAADAGAADAGAADAGTADAGTTGGEGSDPNGLQAALEAAGAGAVFGPLQTAGFVLNISRDSAWTTFLPNDAAVEAASEAGAVFDSAALAAHIHSDGPIPDLDAVVGTTLTMNSNGGSPMFAVEAGADGGLTIGGFNVVSEAINTGGPGFIYIIDGVLPQGN